LNCKTFLTATTYLADNIEPCSQQRWDDALHFCKKELGSADFTLIQQYRTPAELGAAIEEMMENARESSVPRLLRQFKPKILQLQTFSFVMTISTGTRSLQTACLWGLVTLMLEVKFILFPLNIETLADTN